MPTTSLPGPIHPLHLVAGDGAAGCVRAACASFGIPGAVVGFSDDFTQGPLDDEEARVAYMRTLLEGAGHDGIEAYSPFGEWRAVVERLESERPDAVIVWTGDNVADATFLAMACDRLARRQEPMWRVCVTGIDTRAYVAAHPPERLALLYAERELLSAADRRVLAQEFARIRDIRGLVRRLESGRVVGVPIDHYDPLLLAACGPDWRAAAKVVGTAMGTCDGPNLMGDVFFGARLNSLIDAGRIEASGPRTTLRDYSVRLPGR